MHNVVRRSVCVGRSSVVRRSATAVSVYLLPSSLKSVDDPKASDLTTVALMLVASPAVVQGKYRCVARVTHTSSGGTWLTSACCVCLGLAP
jgi:hypothetical protein